MGHGSGRVCGSVVGCFTCPWALVVPETWRIGKIRAKCNNMGRGSSKTVILGMDRCCNSSLGVS